MKKQKTLAKLKKDAQKVFNEYIRKRDSGLPCISCSQFKEDYDAGHYFHVGHYDGLRFDEDNCHAECVGCNRFNDSHLIGYTHNLEIKLGKKKYSALIRRAKKYKKNGYKWSRSELTELIEKYKRKIKEL